MLERDAQLLDETVRKAGEIAADYYNAATRAWDKKDGTPVTDADIAVDTFLKRELMKARPDYGWMSEETADDLSRMQHKRIWIVDPIDGTRSFIERTSEWCIAAALIEDGRPVVARVYRPLEKAMYAAVVGKGATLDGEKISVSNRKHLERARIIAKQAALRSDRWATKWPYVETGIATSLALRLCFIADGTYDGTIAIGEKCDWDLSAGDLIVHEAGGIASGLRGDKFIYNREKTRQPNGMVAAGKDIYKQILKLAEDFKG